MGVFRAQVVRVEFWKAVRRGLLVEEAARHAGVVATTGRRWFAEAGGVIGNAPVEPTGRYLSFAEREEIAIGLAEDRSIRSIARALGRDPSTVSREVARNRAWRGYRAGRAQEMAQQRARRPKPAKLATCARLRAAVENGLRRRWSPEQIAVMLRIDYPADREMRVSHETIYQSLYVQGRGALRRELATCLRTGRALRRPRRRPDERRGQIPGMVNISQRPAEADDRSIPGHWESQCCCQAA